MTAALLDERPARLRWSLSTAAVVLAHLATAAAFLHWSAFEPPPSPPPAMMIDLAPLPAAPRPAEPAPPPPPEPPPEPELPPIEEMTAPVPPPVALPKPPPPKPKRKKPPPKAPPPEPVKAPQPVEEAPAPPAPPLVAPVVEPAAGPPPGMAADRLAKALPSFQQQLLAHLERHKRYPRRARQRRETGIVYVRFVMDHSGAVISSRLERKSGREALDEEALALIARAQPLPTPPPELPARIELVVPVQFSLH